ncbi:hypothetical protein MLD52_08985 [Puniceicoccaceae bacterium K14]|nr:hypothetical protein [Puniceicoccaceae bacterium K14]
MRITGVKINKFGGLNIDYETMNEVEQSWEKRDFYNCKQAPTDEMAQALDDLTPLTMELEELPHSLKGDVTVIGFKLDYQKNEHQAVSLCATRKLKIAGPSVINTPKRNITAESDDAVTLSTHDAVLVDTAQRLAVAYLNGDRKETDEAAACRTAKAKGRTAYEEGKDHMDNPYTYEDDGDDVVNSWLEGYIEAKKEKSAAKAGDSAHEDHEGDEEEAGAAKASNGEIEEVNGESDSAEVEEQEEEATV